VFAGNQSPANIRRLPYVLVDHASSEIMTKLESIAFEQARLRSERRRIFAIIGFVIAFTVAIAIRIMVYGSPMSR
jgi:type IV secretory pathway component VirB8